MKELLWELVKQYGNFLFPIHDSILISEFLIISNHVLCLFVVRKNQKLKPLWLKVFAAFIIIVSTKLFDDYISTEIKICNPISTVICYYYLFLIAKNTGQILGIDFTKYIHIKKPNDENRD